MEQPGNLLFAAKPIGQSDKVLVMVHGRGASATDILSLLPYLPVETFSALAPEAPDHTWYPGSFMAPLQQNQPWLDNSLSKLESIENYLADSGIQPENIYWLGFSQGACLTLEYVCRHAKPYGGVLAFTGGLIGPALERGNYGGDFGSTRVFVGSSDPDPHVPVSRVRETGLLLTELGADTELQVYPGMGHTISDEEIRAAVKHVFSRP